MKVTFQLMRVSGVQGPKTTVEIDENTPWPDLNKQARSWANGQIGHPWDSLVVDFPDGSNEPYDLYDEACIFYRPGL